ncbi:MAG TPA: 3'-5' exonuclease [Saprospiraceae bacterium]|nr:3'-5' exonuclease [Saprospiraceae bacterium]
MKLHLEKDLIFLDVEATGLHVIRDRIIQLAMIKYSAEGKAPVELNWLINPGIPISEEAMQVHGIKPADVANKPIFRQLAAEIFAFIGDADFAGYHSNQFDIPILMEELARCGFELNLDNRRLIDVQRIFYKMEPRTLSAAYRYYCQEEINEAHDALQDVKATIAVLDGQLDMYKDKDLLTEEGELLKRPIKEDVGALHEFTNDLRLVDATQKLKYDVNGEIVFNFGIHRGLPVAKILAEDKQYYHWMLNKEFSFQVKQIIRKLVTEYEKNQKANES